MTYLFKLAKRLSFNHFSIWVVLLAMVACTDAGDPTDPVFQSSSIISMQLWPQDPTLAVGDSIDFIAFGLTAEGDTVVALDVTWSANGGEIKGNGKGRGRYHARAVGRNKVTAVKDSLSDSTTVTVTAVPAASIEVTPATASVAVGRTMRFTATVKDADGNTLTGRSVSWTTNDAACATVNANGTVTGVGPGSATITATSEGQSGAADISVVSDTTEFITGLTPTRYDVARLAVGDQYYVDRTLALTSLPPGLADHLWIRTANDDKAATADPFLSFTLLEDAVVVVAYDTRATVLPNWLQGWDQAPVSIGVSDGGASPLTILHKSFPAGAVGLGGNLAAGAQGAQSMYGVVLLRTSEIDPVALELAPASVTLEPGENAQFSATVTDPLGRPTGGTLEWAATGGTITAQGLYTAGAVPGTYAVTATETGSGLSNSVGVAIRDTNTASVASVEVTPATASISVGATVQLTATLKDAAGNVLTGRAVSWSTSDGAVATVNASGLVRGVAAGAATITATSEGQSGTATVTVTVAPVASVSVTPGTFTLQVGQTRQLTATPRDANGNPLNGRTVTWSSDNTSAATVSASGLVTAVATGTATITATSEGETGSASATVVPQGSVTPVFEELWDYEDSAELLADPNDWFGVDAPPEGGVGMRARGVITLDRIGPAGVGVGKSMRLGQPSRHYQGWWIDTGEDGNPSYNPNGSYSNTDGGTTVGKDINFPGGAIGTEAWFEVWYMFHENFSSNWPQAGGGSDGMKMVFFGTDGGSHGRLQVKAAIGHNKWEVGISTVEQQALHHNGPYMVGGDNRALPFGVTDYWPEGYNGVWHYFRVHIKGSTPGQSDGFFRFHDSKYLRLGPIALGGVQDNPPDAYILENRSDLDLGNGFDGLELGINMNRGPWNTSNTLPTGAQPLTVGYFPGNPVPGQPKTYIPSDWQPGQWYWFGPVRVWNQDPGWGW